MSPFEITLAVSTLILGAYAANGVLNFGKSKSYNSFFLNDRELTPENVRNTFTGAAISVSTVLIFFLTLTPMFGWQIFLSPLTLALGILLFSHAVYPRLTAYPGLMAALRGESEASIDSLGDLVYFLYHQRWLARVVTFISGAGITCVLVAEMMVGVTIYQEYFVRSEYIVFLIAGTLFLYAGLGGMKSVVQTDRWQVRVILISMVSIVLVLAFQETRNQGAQSGPASSMWSGSWAPLQMMPVALIMNMLIVNLAFLPSSLRVWQVVAASAKGKNFKGSLWWSTAMIAAILTCAVFVSRGVAARSPGGMIDLQTIFGFLANNDNGMVAFVVYPLFVSALLSALVSTADSAILPLAQVFASRDVPWRPQTILRNVTVLLVIVIAVYFLVTKVLNFNIVPWILTVLSVTTCIAPAIIVPLFVRKQFSPQASAVVGFGVVLGCVVAFGWSIAFRDISVQPWNCAIGAGISLVCCVVACWMKEGTADTDKDKEVTA